MYIQWRVFMISCSWLIVLRAVFQLNYKQEMKWGTTDLNKLHWPFPANSSGVGSHSSSLMTGSEKHLQHYSCKAFLCILISSCAKRTTSKTMHPGEHICICTCIHTLFQGKRTLFNCMKQVCPIFVIILI